MAAVAASQIQVGVGKSGSPLNSETMPAARSVVGSANNPRRSDPESRLTDLDTCGITPRYVPWCAAIIRPAAQILLRWRLRICTLALVRRHGIAQYANAVDLHFDVVARSQEPPGRLLVADSPWSAGEDHVAGLERWAS